MKINLIVSIGILFLVSACIGGNSGLSKKPTFEFGDVEGNKYINDFFGLEVQLPENWTVDTSYRFKSPFSPHFLEADLFDENENALISLNILGHRRNPFSRDETLVKYLKEENENLKILYDVNDHSESFEPVKIDQTDFILNRIIITSEDQFVYMDEYATQKYDYFYSMTFSYSDTLLRNQINEILKEIRIK